MNKYFKYSTETMQGGNIPLLWHTVNYFLFNNLPKEDMTIKNPNMGTYSCRANTTDFMYSFFSYEYKVKEYIQKHMSNYDVYMDIGACIGDYSVWLSKQGLQCYAFEPSPDNYKCFSKNIDLNNAQDKIKAFNYGLGNSPEKLLFKSHPTNKGYTGQFLVIDGAVEQTVEVKTLDQVVFEEKIDVDQSFILKLDVEGMEQFVVEGGKNFLKSAKRILLIFEAHTNETGVVDTLREICDFEHVYIDELNQGALIINEEGGN